MANGLSVLNLSVKLFNAGTLLISQFYLHVYIWIINIVTNWSNALEWLNFSRWNHTIRCIRSILSSNWFPIGIRSWSTIPELNSNKQSLFLSFHQFQFFSNVCSLPVWPVGVVQNLFVALVLDRWRLYR